jgi:hypothetical protein
MARSKNYAVLLILMMLAAGMAVVSLALDFCCPPEKDLAKLKPEAKAHYDKAAYYLDHVNPEMAISELEKAVAINPEIISLDHFLVELALERARLKFAEESVRYYNIAEKAINEVIKNPKVSDSDRQEAQRKLQIIQSEREKVAERDARRYTVGKVIIKDKLEMLFPTTPTPTPTPMPTIPPPTPYVAPAPGAPPPAAPGAPVSPFAVATPPPPPPRSPEMTGPMRMVP